MKRALLFLLGLALLAAAACGSLDSADHVHDLRMLGIRAEPPEQVFALPISLDAGPSLIEADGGISPDVALALASIQVQPVTVRALVADPDGGGRNIHYQFAVCDALSGDGGRCDLSQPNAYAFKEGDYAPDAGWAELSATFTPKLSLLAAAVQADPYHGFGFLPLPVQLIVHAGDEEVVGFKRVLFTVSFQGEPTPTPNQNPFIPAVFLDGDVWSATVPPVLADRCAHAIAPVVVDGGQETYSRQKFDGSSIQFRESWRYNFFATGGGFTAAATGGAGGILGTPQPTDTTWQPDDGEAPGEVTYFLVVRDGRGGEGWTVREARFAPDGG